jgi:hypothetical protein
MPTSYFALPSNSSLIYEFWINPVKSWKSSWSSNFPKCPSPNIATLGTKTSSLKLLWDVYYETIISEIIVHDEVLFFFIVFRVIPILYMGSNSFLAFAFVKATVNHTKHLSIKAH